WLPGSCVRRSDLPSQPPSSRERHVAWIAVVGVTVSRDGASGVTKAPPLESSATRQSLFSCSSFPLSSCSLPRACNYCVWLSPVSVGMHVRNGLKQPGHSECCVDGAGEGALHA